MPGLNELREASRSRSGTRQQPFIGPILHDPDHARRAAMRKLGGGSQQLSNEERIQRIEQRMQDFWNQIDTTESAPVKRERILYA